MLGISLLQCTRRQAEAAWPGLSTEELLDQLRQIQKYTLLYPPQAARAKPSRHGAVQTITDATETAQELGLDQLGIT